METIKERKSIRIMNIILSVLFSIFIVLEIFILISYFTQKVNSINICGGIPYVALYSDESYGFNDGDLIITFDKNILKDKIIKEYGENGKIIITTGTDYNLLNSTKDANKIFSIKIHNLGKFILFIRELYSILVITILISVIYLMIYIFRFKNNEYYTDRYKRIREIKDIVIFIFIVTTYITMFFIGKATYKNEKKSNDNIKEYVERNIIDQNTNTQDDNTVNTENTTNIGNNVNNIITNYNKGNNGTNDNIIDSDINFIVTENSKSWNQLSNLNIFKDEYSRSNKIYPGLSGKYEFRVENKSDFEVEYKINMQALKNADINLKYKIIKNGIYLNNEYMDIDKIFIPNYDISSGKVDTYVIDWKWIDNDSVDTEIGKNAEKINYILKILVNASQK